jgi:hypothetical protein
VGELAPTEQDAHHVFLEVILTLTSNVTTFEFLLFLTLFVLWTLVGNKTTKHLSKMKTMIKLRSVGTNEEDKFGEGAKLTV